MPREYRLNRAVLRDASMSLDTEAERLTEYLQLGMTSDRDRRAIVERRAKLWRTAKLIREVLE